MSFACLHLSNRDACLQGRAQFQVYQRYLALAFAAVQGSGQLFFLRQFAPDFSPIWFASNLSVLVAGAMVLIYVRPPAASTTCSTCSPCTLQQRPPCGCSHPCTCASAVSPSPSSRALLRDIQSVSCSSAVIGGI